MERLAFSSRAVVHRAAAAAAAGTRSSSSGRVAVMLGARGQQATVAPRRRGFMSPPVGNQPKPFAERPEVLPEMPRGWKATTSAPKKTTLLTGLAVVPNAREKLYALYEETLRSIRQIEEGTPYRELVEKVTRHRMKIVFDQTDVEEIEEAIGCGPIESLMDHARDELELIPEMADWKPWEVKGPRREVMIIDEERAKAYLRGVEEQGE